MYLYVCVYTELYLYVYTMLYLYQVLIVQKCCVYFLEKLHALDWVMQQARTCTGLGLAPG